MLGVLLVAGLDVLADGPPPPLGLTSSTMMMAINATASSATIAMSGQVHALRRRGVGVSEVGGNPPPMAPVAAPLDGSSRVAAVPMGLVYEAKAFSPAIPGTAAIASLMSPRRTACAARARCAAEAGRS